MDAHRSEGAGERAAAREVCDLRIWTLTSGMDAATVHVIIHGGDVDEHGILHQMRHTLPRKCGVTLPRIHFEPEVHIENPAGF